MYMYVCIILRSHDQCLIVNQLRSHKLHIHIYLMSTKLRSCDQSLVVNLIKIT